MTKIPNSNIYPLSISPFAWGRNGGGGNQKTADCAVSGDLTSVRDSASSSYYQYSKVFEFVRNKTLILLARAFESVVDQPAQDDDDDPQNDQEYIGKIHKFLKLSFVRFNGNDHEKYSHQTRENKYYRNSLIKFFAYHIFSSPKFDKYKAIYRKITMTSRPPIETANLDKKDIPEGMTWLTVIPRNKPLATSLKKSASKANCDFEKLSILQSHHNQALINCQ